MDWIGWRVSRGPKLSPERGHRRIRQRTNVLIKFKVGNSEEDCVAVTRKREKSAAEHYNEEINKGGVERHS